MIYIVVELRHCVCFFYVVVGVVVDLLLVTGLGESTHNVTFNQPVVEDKVDAHHHDHG